MTAPAGQGKGLAVADIAQAILAAVVDHFNAAPGVTLPERRVIAGGNPRLIAWDCDQLAVSMSGIGLGWAPGQGGQARQTGNPVSTNLLRHAVFAVQLVRHVPTMSEDGDLLPAADEITKAGLRLLRDAGLLSHALTRAVGAVRTDTRLGHGSATAGAIEMIGPDGGMAAVEGSIAITAANLS